MSSSHSAWVSSSARFLRRQSRYSARRDRGRRSTGSRTACQLSPSAGGAAASPIAYSGPTIPGHWRSGCGTGGRSAQTETSGRSSRPASRGRRLGHPRTKTACSIGVPSDAADNRRALLLRSCVVDVIQIVEAAGTVLGDDVHGEEPLPCGTLQSALARRRSRPCRGRALPRCSTSPGMRRENQV